MSHFLIKPHFYSKAKELRKYFVDQFSDSRLTSSKRFVWDYWYIKDQYNLIRTPAVHYFPQKLYSHFHSNLVQWGRETLGCHDISPPWLSYYVDGCFQNMHTDVPHGPWAFVYSLTTGKNFSGGETFILKPTTLNYWSAFNDQIEHEADNFLQTIPSPFNQLTLFDPRFPHGVTEVKGTRDPLQARIVIHGWFVEPRPYVVGGLTTAQTQKGLDSVFQNLESNIADLFPLHGTISLRLNVNKQGLVQKYRILSNTVLSLSGQPENEKHLQKELKRLFSKATFPAAKSASQMTIPLLFK